MQETLASTATVDSTTTLRSHPDLRIETWAISALKPLGRQSRHHTAAQIRKIAASIQQFGFVSPLLIDSGGAVLAGVARLAAAKTLGMTALPAVVVDHLTSAEQRAYVLADNRLAELAGWNKEALKLELADLAELELDFSLEVTGFSLPEIDAIRFGVGESDAEDDEVPGARTEIVSQVGDLWLLGEHRLLVGDSTSPEALDRLLAEDQVRSVFTDAPYNVAIQGHVTSTAAHGRFVMGDGEMSDGEFTGFLEATCRQIERCMVDGGVAYFCMDWRHMRNVLDAAEAAKLAVLNLCVWDKGTGGMGSFYRSQHELVFVLKKGTAAHLNTVELGKNGRNRSNVWAYPSVNGFGADKARERAMHPTVKPLALVKDAILDSSKKGDVVLDLFGGSGTTLIAAQISGRRARVMELDPRYADVIIRRFEAMSGKEAVHATLGLTFRSLSFERPEGPSPPPARARARVRA
ncbi:MAG: methylase domain protein [Caulobacteraceae bacterium]|jgi:DNA modification methylase|nr:methylase domain protein [Caulobacteraceae bacterium]